MDALGTASLSPQPQSSAAIGMRSATSPQTAAHNSVVLDLGLLVGAGAFPATAPALQGPWCDDAGQGAWAAPASTAWGESRCHGPSAPAPATVVSGDQLMALPGGRLHPVAGAAPLRGFVEPSAFSDASQPQSFGTLAGTLGPLLADVDCVARLLEVAGGALAADAPHMAETLGALLGGGGGGAGSSVSTRASRAIDSSLILEVASAATAAAADEEGGALSEAAERAALQALLRSLQAAVQYSEGVKGRVASGDFRLAENERPGARPVQSQQL